MPAVTRREAGLAGVNGAQSPPRPPSISGPILLCLLPTWVIVNEKRPDQEMFKLHRHDAFASSIIIHDKFPVLDINNIIQDLNGSQPGDSTASDDRICMSRAQPNMHDRVCRETVKTISPSSSPSLGSLGPHSEASSSRPRSPSSTS